MYSYETRKPDDEIMNLFKYYYPEKYAWMRLWNSKGLIKFFVCCIHKEKVIGAMGIKLHDKKKKWYRFYHLVVHPDHRRKGIGNSIRYMSLKFLIDMKAKHIDFFKMDNVFGHERFKRLGFRFIEKRINNITNEVFSQYRQSVRRLDKKELVKEWQNITLD